MEDIIQELPVLCGDRNLWVELGMLLQSQDHRCHLDGLRTRAEHNEDALHSLHASHWITYFLTTLGPHSSLRLILGRLISRGISSGVLLGVPTLNHPLDVVRKSNDLSARPSVYLKVA